MELLGRVTVSYVQVRHGNRSICLRASGAELTQLRHYSIRLANTKDIKYFLLRR